MGLLAPRRILLRRPAAVLAVVGVAAALGLAACGDDDDSADRPKVPDGAVAVVGDESITPQELKRQVAVLRRGQSGSAKAATSALRQQALSTLLLARALEQEAAERGIAARPQEVRDRWDAATRQQFRTRKALRRFLHGQTRQDVLDQLRLQMLNERVLADVAEKAGGGKEGQRAAREFQREFQERWRERTACRDAKQATGLCGDAR